MDDTPDRDGDLDQGRMRVLDAKPVNLDGFSVANPDLGLVAMHSPFDPEPSLVVTRRGASSNSTASRPTTST